MAPPPRGDFEEIRWGIPQNVKSFPVALRTNRCESDHASCKADYDRFTICDVLWGRVQRRCDSGG